MKQFFIAYRYSGEDLMTLEQRINTVTMALATHNIKAYATLSEESQFVQNKVTAGEIMKQSFAKIDTMDGLFVLLAGSQKSEGQLMELGYAIAKKKPIIVAYQEGVNTYVHELATQWISYSDLKDLSKQIVDMKL
jgi:nucleoside 2-deoxyribosyltransferase